MDAYVCERIWASSYWYHALLSLIVPGIFILLIIYFYKYSEWEFSGIAFIVSIVLLVGSVVGLFYWRGVRASSVECEERSPTQVLQDTKLYSLANGTKTEGQGNFGILGGSFVISGTDTYRYYYKEGNRIRQSNVPASSTYIEYITDENTAPHLVKIKSWKQVICRYNGEESIWDYDTQSFVRTYYILYVPEGSVVESFELN